jgi:folate-binding protein YgfZ
MSNSILIHRLPTLGLTRVTGPDARDYLNRRLCQKITDIPVGEGRRAFLLDAVGKMQLDLEVYAQGPDLLLVAPPPGREEVLPQLERFVFSESCSFNDISESYAAFMIAGSHGHDLLGDLDLPVPRVHHIASADDVLVLGSDYALGQCLLLVPAASADDWTQRLIDAARIHGGRQITAEEFTELRILAGQPAWMTDIGPDDMPLDAPSLRHGVHFSKGCFPGQEALARVENLGHPAKCLIRLRSQAKPAGDQLELRDEDTDESVGRLTSWAPHSADHTIIGLALVKWSARDAGRRFNCGDVLFESTGPVPTTEAFGR